MQKKLNLKAENIAVVGDQIFTDVIGGNRCKMFTILVDPVDKKDFWYTAWKRPIENKIKKKLNKGLDAIFGGDITSLIDFNDVNIVYYIIVAILRPFCWRIRKLDE